MKLACSTLYDIVYNLFETLPTCLERMKQINHLSLDENPFSEDEKDRIQAVLGIWF